MNKEQREQHDLRLEVLSLRTMIHADDHHLQLSEQLKRAEQKLRMLEQTEARAWRLRNRERWLREGEAPTRYFYAQAKAKFNRETIHKLQLQDGSTTTDKDVIMAQVQGYYTNLYQREETIGAALIARREALATLTKKLNDQVFNNARRILSQYEQASGARLNLAKTTVIPLFDDPVPHWLHATGCHIASRQERFRYLGVLAGIDILDDEITADVHNRYEKRLKSWATKLLAWPEKTLLCRNILGALPYYTLMTVGMSKKGMKLLQKTTREFLWGENEHGKKKRPLIAWATFEKRKHDGGLGWPPHTDMADAFLLKNAAKILKGGQEEWIKIARAMITKALKDSSRTKEIKNWTVEQVFIGLPSFKTGSSPTLDRMLQVWFKAQKRLRWVPARGSLPMRSSPTLITAVARRTGFFRQEELTELCKSLKAAKIKDTADVLTSGGVGKNLHDYLLGKLPHITPVLITALHKLQIAFPETDTEDIPWSEAHGWTWTDNLPQGQKAWTLSTANWRALLHHNINDDATLSCRWEIQDDPRQWRTRWNLLWNGPTKIRTKIRLWRYLRRGYFTNSKAKTWGIDDGTCSRCQIEVETFVHAIWSCPRIQERARWISWLLIPSNQRTTSNRGCESLITVIDFALQNHRANPACITLLLNALRTNWIERNESQFRERQAYRGVNTVLHETNIEIMALMDDSRLSTQRDRSLKRAHKMLEYWRTET
ncbi:hypothetical protein R1sor_011057 [Riccia sorocarpa]|uniref:Reverse transcriptase zinc-binding domain-containing protein n=1 Tax=Riccia sorocarpa TaxID=122646 RepID=A0ABD3I123_9MARC